MLNENDSAARRLQSLTYKVQEHRLEKAWIRFENAGFKPILIKGWAAAQVYPNPSERDFNDIDLMIDSSRYVEAVNFLETFKSDKFGSNPGIDLHKDAKTLDTVSFENLYARSKTVVCGETDVRVLCPEDHLRILCVHWLVDSGAKKEKLWDIYYALENRPADFNWDRCLNAAGPTRRKWIVCVVGLTGKYLGLNIEDTPLAKEAADLPRWLIKAVEREWQSDVKLRSIHYVLRDRKEFWRQIKKRIPPNPIQATVDLNGEFNDQPRIFYQVGDVFLRLNPWLKRIFKIE